MRMRSQTPSGLKVEFFAENVMWLYPVLGKDDESYVVVEMAEGTELKLVPMDTLRTRETVEAMAKELARACPHVLARKSGPVTHNEEGA